MVCRIIRILSSNPPCQSSTLSRDSKGRSDQPVVRSEGAHIVDVGFRCVAEVTAVSRFLIRSLFRSPGVAVAIVVDVLPAFSEIAFETFGERQCLSAGAIKCRTVKCDGSSSCAAGQSDCTGLRTSSSSVHADIDGSVDNSSLRDGGGSSECIAVSGNLKRSSSSNVDSVGKTHSHHIGGLSRCGTVYKT